MKLRTAGAWSAMVLVLASCSPHHESGTEPGCLFGAYASPRGGFGASREEATLLDLEERIAGRRMDLDRLYRRWDDAIPGEREARTIAVGRIPVVSFTSTRYSTDSPPIPWAAIARGDEDAHLA